ncbi:MAG: hypothetical protein J6C75_03860, partial [Oscillospiraceae bacterium]|nr:hypothetical protein [Oscillospiraceae bacterium]
VALMALHKPLGINKGQSPLFVPLVTFVTHESNCPRGMSANEKKGCAVAPKRTIVKQPNACPRFIEHKRREK